MQGGLLTTVVLPAALFLIMFGMGLGLSLTDFSRVLKLPRAALIGVICQMFLLPLLGYLVVVSLGLTGPLAVGLMILTFCPGGVTSNMFSLLARGDVALSITLTAVVSLLAPFTIPFLVQWSMQTLMPSASGAIQMPIAKTIAQLLAITIIPVSLGMLLRRFKPRLATRADRAVKIASVVILFAIIAALIKKNWAGLPSLIADAGVSTLILNISTMLLGYGVAVLARLTRPQRVTIGLEVGIQNGTTALLVAAIAADAAAMPEVNAL
ncbi:MAG: bile acid:sodium symporter family protein, partial [Nannocystaceae bacterium]